jgi:chromosome segregation ATPase
MAESREDKVLKVKSFRIDNETAQKFKDISDGLGTNQQDTMQILINAYCMQEQKVALNDYKADLDKFENYTTALLQMFTTALQSNKDVRELVRTEFEASLKSKDTIIQELQGKLAESKATKEESVARAKELEQITADLQQQLTTIQSQLSDKDNLNKALISSCDNLESKIATLEEKQKHYNECMEELAEQQDKFIQVQDMMLELKNKIKANDDAHENQIKALQEQAKIDVKMAILEVKEECQVKIDGYQQEYKALLDQMNKTDKEN